MKTRKDICSGSQCNAIIIQIAGCQFNVESISICIFDLTAEPNERPKPSQFYFSNAKWLLSVSQSIRPRMLIRDTINHEIVTEKYNDVSGHIGCHVFIFIQLQRTLSITVFSPLRRICIVDYYYNLWKRC